MPENQDHNFHPAEDHGSVPNRSEGFRTVPQDSERFGNIPHTSESFRSLPNDAERFGNLPKSPERTESHTLTVREVARMFELAGVARTERSIVNWCQPNKTGVARLDSYFDPNERKYYISPQSVELAIAEEKAKADKAADGRETFGKFPQDADGFGTLPNSKGRAEKHFPDDSESREIKELENQIRDLQITNKAKDIVIDQMQKERNGFFEQVVAANRRVGELEARIFQLEGPKS